MDLSWLESKSWKDVPACSWIDFCEQVGIEKAEWAERFLIEVATHKNEDFREGLPDKFRSKAKENGRNPYMIIMWILAQECRAAPRLMFQSHQWWSPFGS